LNPAQYGSHHRQHVQSPAMDGGVVDQDAALGHHLFEIA
jgi:hypothetical protein